MKKLMLLLPIIALINCLSAQNTDDKSQVKKEITETKIIACEKMPCYPGGEEALLKYLSKNMSYPEQARNENVTGTVYISFIVSQNGDLKNIQILKGLGYECDEEAIRLIKNMPYWEPGEQRGKPIEIQYNMPIKFPFTKENKWE